MTLGWLENDIQNLVLVRKTFLPRPGYRNNGKSLTSPHSLEKIMKYF